jgi:hypothetical protein
MEKTRWSKSAQIVQGLEYSTDATSPARLLGWRIQIVGTPSWRAGSKIAEQAVRDEAPPLTSDPQGIVVL